MRTSERYLLHQLLPVKENEFYIFINTHRSSLFNEIDILQSANCIYFANKWIYDT
jgi:hypothetical protein